jgi:glycosyltransferase involved in cell wall biosynthesis
MEPFVVACVWTDALPLGATLRLFRRLQHLPGVRAVCSVRLAAAATEAVLGRPLPPGGADAELSWAAHADLVLLPNPEVRFAPEVARLLEEGVVVLTPDTPAWRDLLGSAWAAADSPHGFRSWATTISRFVNDPTARDEARRRAQARGRSLVRRLAREPVDAGATAGAAEPVRVGIVTPGLLLGGAERWIVDLLHHTDRTRLCWEGVALVHPDHQDPRIMELVQQVCPVELGEAGVAQLAGRCDVVLIWGMGDTGRFFRGDRRCRVVLVSHGSGYWAARAAADSAYAEGLVAVSQAARDPFPATERSRVSLLYNGVAPERVTVRQAPAETRRAWGVPKGKRVLGYLGRLSSEKHPLALPLTLEYLSHDWVGIMVGTGPQTEAVQAYSRVAVGNRLRFPGVTNDVGSTLAAFDWLLLPSYEEACSLTLIEAWLSRRPVLATPVGLLGEYPQFARLIPVGARGEPVAHALAADLADSEGTAARVQAAYEFAQRHLTLAPFARRWTDYLTRIATAPHRVTEAL